MNSSAMRQTSILARMVLREPDRVLELHNRGVMKVLPDALNISLSLIEQRKKGVDLFEALGYTKHHIEPIDESHFNDTIDIYYYKIKNFWAYSVVGSHPFLLSM